jgi:hypothetical protein
VKNMEALEMDPHGVGGIGQSALREGVGCEEVAEFVVYPRFRNSLDQSDRHATGEGQQPNQEN